MERTQCFHMHGCMITGTNDSHKVPMVNYLEEATVSSHFKRLSLDGHLKKVRMVSPSCEIMFEYQTHAQLICTRPQGHTGDPSLFMAKYHR
jgi:hypothetical protein